MNKIKILVVDDNRDFCENIKDILKIAGYEVVVAYDGQIALEFVKKESFDYIIMDLIMPGMSGVSTIKAIRKMSLKTPIIVVTAFGEESIVQEAFASGANKKLGKPIDFDILLNEILKSDP